MTWDSVFLTKRINGSAYVDSDKNNNFYTVFALSFAPSFCLRYINVSL